jgi:ribonucleotide monophosphatase NagD (HAD superfamily)
MINMKNKPKTIFCDIDGTLIHHTGDIIDQCKGNTSILVGTLDKLREWDRKGYNIILTTGRREGMRDLTEALLNRMGIIYDQLIMGIGGGTRVLINDRKPNSEEDTAIAINLTRNKGIYEINI